MPLVPSDAGRCFGASSNHAEFTAVMHAHNMGAEFLDHADGVIKLKVSGMLTQEELARMQAAAGAIMSAGGKWRVLVITDNFAGWERGAKWDDFSFQAQHDSSIQKMAIVGELHKRRQRAPGSRHPN